MDKGLTGLGKKKDYYSTENVSIPIINTRSVKSTINFIAREIRERVKEGKGRSSRFMKEMISKGRYETHIKLVKIEVGKEITNFIYQINTIVREQKKVY